ncbi:MAG: 4,5-DOPA dioxygenase extradiol [Saprospiraceae bacterium]|nr:4,5-DOPA dioxygenase extradiol [Candidatus Defluviibacterium haderslevense]
MITLAGLSQFTNGLNEEDHLMPLFFIGHGSPMNGIENNAFSQEWKKKAESMPIPKAIICISAHWLTRGTFITAMDHPKTIHDFGGFPDELYKVEYNAPGDLELAKETSALIKKTQVKLDHDWGLDHGTWTVVRHMYPQANIPVLQLSIDYYQPAQYHYELAKELSALRKKGILIIGSGNMVHNLGMLSFDKGFINEYGYDWAIEMNQIFKQKILDQDHNALIKYESLNAASKLAIPSPDHYLPLIYTLGLQNKQDKISFFNDVALAGSITMTSVQFS